MDIIRDGILWQHIMERLASGDFNHSMTLNFHAWTDGEQILVDNEASAEYIADFLEILGFDTVVTGYYDPKDDEASGEVDDHTGWYYIDI